MPPDEVTPPVASEGDLGDWLRAVARWLEESPLADPAHRTDDVRAAAREVDRLLAENADLRRSLEVMAAAMDAGHE